MMPGTRKLKEILVLNRRDIKNPLSGGAEIYTHEIFRRLTDKYNVTHFSSAFRACEREQTTDNIRYVRRGNELTVHAWGLVYALRNRNRFDLLIDQFNGTGFMTFAFRNSVILVHQLYERFWTAELGLLGWPLRIAEPLLLKLYKNKPAIAVSDSTSEDLKRLGFKDIEIVHNGLDIIPPDKLPLKESSLTLIFLGRLRKTKNPEDAIRAFTLIRKAVPDVKLLIAGDGPLYDVLAKKYAGIENIRFLGFVDGTAKYDYLKKAHFLLVPSIREGWGQVVIQANAVGTPAIGYAVQGLKDSIQNDRTGALVKNYEEMSQKATELWKDTEKYQMMCRNALDWAGNFSWEKAVVEFRRYLAERGIK